MALLRRVDAERGHLAVARGDAAIDPAVQHHLVDAVAGRPELPDGLTRARRRCSDRWPRASRTARSRPGSSARRRRRATGFDPSARRTAWSVVEGLRALGKTVFLTTHSMDEAEFLADRIAVIADGAIVAEGTPQALGGRDRLAPRICFTRPQALGVADLPDALRRLVQPGANGVVSLRSDSPPRQVGELAGWAGSRGLELADLDARRPTLEDVYLALTDPGEES